METPCNPMARLTLTMPATTIVIESLHQTMCSHMQEEQYLEIQTLKDCAHPINVKGQTYSNIQKTNKMLVPLL